MILVADSGSSKTDWILTLPDLSSINFRTSGINPFFLTEKEISKHFLNTPEIQPYINTVKEIYFFGAGCSSPDGRELVSNALCQVFKNAFINIDQDNIGSVYATCGTTEGLSCILGTGSNISYFDGDIVHSGKHGLGYILGDEGSGTYFGKKLITSFLYGTMPNELQKDFNELYKLDKETVIKQVYKKPFPNSYLASFSRFMSHHLNHPFIANLLHQGFEEYFKTNIAYYKNYRLLNCHFVGSIAFHFQDALKQVCEENGVRVGKILKQPIGELSKFIIERETENLKNL